MSRTHKFLISVSASFLPVRGVEGICDKQRWSADLIQLAAPKVTFLFVVEVHRIHNVTLTILEDPPNCTTYHVTGRLGWDAEANPLPWNKEQEHDVSHISIRSSAYKTKICVCVCMPYLSWVYSGCTWLEWWDQRQHPHHQAQNAPPDHSCGDSEANNTHHKQFVCTHSHKITCISISIF